MNAKQIGPRARWLLPALLAAAILLVVVFRFLFWRPELAPSPSASSGQKPAGTGTVEIHSLQQPISSKETLNPSESPQRPTSPRAGRTLLSGTVLESVYAVLYDAFEFPHQFHLEQVSDDLRVYDDEFSDLQMRVHGPESDVRAIDLGFPWRTDVLHSARHRLGALQCLEVIAGVVAGDQSTEVRDWLRGALPETNESGQDASSPQAWSGWNAYCRIEETAGRQYLWVGMETAGGGNDTNEPVMGFRMPAGKSTTAMDLELLLQTLTGARESTGFPVEFGLADAPDSQERRYADPRSGLVLQCSGPADNLDNVSIIRPLDVSRRAEDQQYAMYSLVAFSIVLNCCCADHETEMLAWLPEAIVRVRTGGPPQESPVVNGRQVKVYVETKDSHAWLHLTLANVPEDTADVRGVVD
jgi:hypothetical protein